MVACYGVLDASFWPLEGKGNKAEPKRKQDMVGTQNIMRGTHVHFQAVRLCERLHVGKEF